MKKDRNFIIAVIFLAVIFIHALFPAGAYGQESSFSAVLTVDEESIEYHGEADYVRNPSIISIIFISDDLRCGYHFTNLEETLKPQSYLVQNENSPNFGGVCVQQNASERERLATESGEITIEAFSRNLVKGTVDVVFKGGLTGKMYHLTGSFSAPSVD